MHGQRKVVFFLLIIFLITITASCSKSIPPAPTPAPLQPMEISPNIKELASDTKEHLENTTNQIEQTKLKVRDFYENYKKYNSEEVESLYQYSREYFKKADKRIELSKKLMNEVEYIIKENKNGDSEMRVASNLRKILLYTGGDEIIMICRGIKNKIDELTKNFQ